MSTTVSVSDVQTALAESRISSAVLSEADIESLLRMCVYDGTLEMYNSGYRARIVKEDKSAVAFEEITQAPCGICPVAKYCAPDAVINPQQCEYFDHWLKGETTFSGASV